MSILISNIQRMCLTDGPGIRTTVFTKGCTLRCPWCSNPENLTKEVIYYLREEKCLKSKSGCPFEKMCGIKTEHLTMTQEELEAVHCPIDAVGQYGREIGEEELLKEILKDRNYWGEEGGVTFSGGEAILWARELEPVLRKLNDEGISVAVETALYIERDRLEIFSKYAELFYVDIKILDKKKCSKILGVNPQTYTDNVDFLTKNSNNIIFRIPCSDKYTLDDENLQMIVDFCRKYKKYPVELFSVHSLGDEKYRSMGLEPPEKLSCSKINQLKDRLIKQGNIVRELSL